jgi:hypothetical protein
VHANDARALGLRFDGERVGCAPFRIRGVTYEPADAVSAFFDYYAANPALVQINLI